MIQAVIFISLTNQVKINVIKLPFLQLILLIIFISLTI